MLIWAVIFSSRGFRQSGSHSAKLLVRSRLLKSTWIIYKRQYSHTLLITLFYWSLNQIHWVNMYLISWESWNLPIDTVVWSPCMSIWSFIYNIPWVVSRKKLSVIEVALVMFLTTWTSVWSFITHNLYQ